MKEVNMTVTTTEELLEIRKEIEAMLDSALKSLSDYHKAVIKDCEYDMFVTELIYKMLEAIALRGGIKVLEPANHVSDLLVDTLVYFTTICIEIHNKNFSFEEGLKLFAGFSNYKGTVVNTILKEFLI